MKEQLKTLLMKLKHDEIHFADVLEFINSHYEHQPTAFQNGEVYNEESQNQGSARVFAFAMLNKLSKDDTLCLFAEHYQSVLNNVNGTDHQNIRQFMNHGWPGIDFKGNALLERSAIS